MDDVTMKVANLQASFEAGMREINRRFREQEDRAVERHQENSGRLDGINGKVGKAHDRASALESVVAAIQAEILRVRTNYHNLNDRCQAWMGGKPIEAGDKDLQKRTLTIGDLKGIIALIVSCLLGGAGFTVWVLKLAGKL